MDWFSWSLMAAFMWSLQPLFDKYGVTIFNNSYAALGVRCLGGIVGLILIPFFWHSIANNNPPINWKAPVALFLAGMFGSVIGQICYLNALKGGEVSRVPAVTAVWPLMTFIMSIFIYKEVITAKKIAAFVMIVGGAVMLNF